MEIGSVVQFTEEHKWRGCLGIITEIKEISSPETIVKDKRYMVAVKIPMEGTAFIYVMESENDIEYIGEAKLVPREKAGEDSE